MNTDKFLQKHLREMPSKKRVQEALMLEAKIYIEKKYISDFKQFPLYWRLSYKPYC